MLNAKSHIKKGRKILFFISVCLVLSTPLFIFHSKSWGQYAECWTWEQYAVGELICSGSPASCPYDYGRPAIHQPCFRVEQGYRECTNVFSPFGRCTEIVEYEDGCVLGCFTILKCKIWHKVGDGNEYWIQFCAARTSGTCP